MKTIPRPTSQPEVIIICWLWTLGLSSIYPNLKPTVQVFFIPSYSIQLVRIWLSYTSISKQPIRLLMRWILEFQKLFIWQIPMETVWNCVGIVPKRKDPSNQKMSLIGLRDLWIWRVCSRPFNQP